MYSCDHCKKTVQDYYIGFEIVDLPGGGEYVSDIAHRLCRECAERLSDRRVYEVLGLLVVEESDVPF